MMIGVGLDARLGLPFDQLRAAAREAERLGFESLWTPAGGVPDSFHICAAWSQDTSLRSGISVVPAARMWTPPSLAVQAATLAQLSAGRFVLGLGTGGYGPGFWASVGLPDRPIAVMREYVTEVRALLAGQQVTAEPDRHRAGLVRAPPGGRSPPRSGWRACRRHRCTWPRSARRCCGSPVRPPTGRCSTGPRRSVSRSAGRTIDAGAARAGREPGAVPMTMYIRVCIDDDVAAARQAFGAQVLGYAMGRPGIPQGAGYRGLFAQMGFDAELSELEQRRDRGAVMPELVAAVSDEMLQAVGYYGPAGPAPAAFARLSDGTGRGHRPDHHHPARPGAGRPGHDRTDAAADQGGGTGLPGRPVTAQARAGRSGRRRMRPGPDQPADIRRRQAGLTASPACQARVLWPGRATRVWSYARR